MSEKHDYSRRSSIASRSESKDSFSSYGGTLSDVEDDGKKYYTLAKKLAKDKKALKVRVKELLSLIESKDKNLDKLQNYFHSESEQQKTQITHLAHDRKKLVKINEEQAKELSVLKDKLKSCERKTEQYESDLENLEDIEDQDQPQTDRKSVEEVVLLRKRLEQQESGNTYKIDTLRDEFKKEREVLVKKISALQDALKQEQDSFHTLRKETEEKMKRAQEVFERNQQELRNNTENDKSTRAELKKEREEVIARITKEKDLITIEFQNYRKTVEANTQTDKKRLEERLTLSKQEVTEMKTECERIRISMVKQVEGIKQSLIKEKEQELQTLRYSHKEELKLCLQSLQEKISKLTEELENREKLWKDNFDQERSEFSKAIKTQQNITENNRRIYEQEKQVIITENNKKLDECTNSLKKEQEEHMKSVSRLQTEINKILAIQKNHEEEIKSTHSRAIHDHLSLLTQREKEITNLKLKIEKISGEAEETMNELKNNSNILRDTIRKEREKYTETTQTLSRELYTQKEQYEKELKISREATQILDKQITKIAQETVDEINNMERKIDNLSQELKETQERLTASKILISKLETSLSRSSSEIDSNREQSLSYQEKIQKIQLDHMNTEFRYKSDYETLKRENNTNIKRIEALTEELHRQRDNTESTQSKIRALEVDLERKEKSLLSQKREIDTLKVDLGRLDSEISKLRKGYLDELNEKLQSLSSEKERIIIDLSQKFSIVEKANRSLEQMRMELQQNLNATSIDRDRYKILADATLEKEKGLLSYQKKIGVLELTIQSYSSEKQQQEYRISMLQDRERLHTDKISSKERVITDLQKQVDSTLSDLYKAQHRVSHLEGEVKTQESRIQILTSNPNREADLKTTELENIKLSSETVKRLYERDVNSLKISLSEKEQVMNNLNICLTSLQTEKDKLLQEINYYKDYSEKLIIEIKRLVEAEVFYKAREVDVNIYKGEVSRLGGIIESLKKQQEEHARELQQELQNKTGIIQELTKTLKDREEQLIFERDRINQVSLHYQQQVEEAKRHSTEEINRMKQAEKENVKYHNQLEQLEKQLGALHQENANLIAEMKGKALFITKKEEDLKRLEESYKNLPPKLADPSMKKARDDALTQLRLARLEATRVKDENNNLTQKLGVTEALISDLEREKSLILQAQRDLKETFVSNLNQQQEKHEKELMEKINRIQHLETLLTGKM